MLSLEKIHVQGKSNTWKLHTRVRQVGTNSITVDAVDNARLFSQPLALSRHRLSLESRHHQQQ